MEEKRWRKERKQEGAEMDDDYLAESEDGRFVNEAVAASKLIELFNYCVIKDLSSGV